MAFDKQNILLAGAVFVLVLLVAVGAWGFSWSLFGAEFDLVPTWALGVLLIFYPTGSNSRGWSAEVGGPFLVFLSLVVVWLIRRTPIKLLHLMGATLLIAGSFAPWMQFEWIGKVSGIEIDFAENGSVQFANHGGLVTLLWGGLIAILVFMTPNFVKRPKRLIAVNLGSFGSIAVVTILTWGLHLIRDSFSPEPEFGVLMIVLGLLLMGSAEIRDSREKRA